MSSPATSRPDAALDETPGASLGLPASGPGSLATWNARLAALVIDWAACSIVARLFLGAAVTNGHGWQAFGPLALYFLEKSVLTALAGGSFGQLLCRLAVVRLDRQPLGWARSIARAAMKVVLVPAIVIGAERRGLDDIGLGTVVVNRR